MTAVTVRRGRFYLARDGSEWQCVEDIMKLPAPSGAVPSYPMYCKCVKADPGLVKYSGTEVGRANWYARDGRWSHMGQTDVDLVEEIQK